MSRQERPGAATTPMAGYRPEIDGLRAIAVLAVVLFHARIRGVPGGFVGVDIFLVISGYLIAQLILRESEAGTFTLIDFYERRVRRILPALLTMLGVSGAVAWMLLPNDFQPLGESLTAISLFVSNLLFWHWGGYFNLAGNATPLLHTWSLAVEEQFYLFFPALLLLARRGGLRAIRITLIAGTLASFVFSVWATHGHAAMAFYSPFSRAWEFLGGAVLAARIVPALRTRLAGDGAAAAGLAAIASAICLFNEKSPFPGIAALLPVLGTMLVLFGTQVPTSRVARVLSARPLVAIGLISYSLYLWHWPMIVFGGYYALNPYGHIRIAMALLAFPVAWASWRFIELPFRKPRSLLSRRSLFAVAGAASIALALYGAGAYFAHGFPGRFDPVVERLSEKGAKPDYGCADRPIATLRSDDRCRIGGSAAPASFALWGDSHAAVYFPALDALARRYGLSGYDLSSLGCPPPLRMGERDGNPEHWMLNPGNQQRCRVRNAEVLNFLAATRPRVVLLAARWSVYTGKRDGQTDRRDPVFEAMIKQLHALGTEIYVVQDVPAAPLAEPRARAMAQLLGATRDIEPRLADYLRRDADFRARASELQRRGLIRIIEPARELCGPRTCRITSGGYPLYYDSNHLGARGAALVAPAFEPVMRALAATPRKP